MSGLSIPGRWNMQCHTEACFWGCWNNHKAANESCKGVNPRCHCSKESGNWSKLRLDLCEVWIFDLDMEWDGSYWRVLSRGPIWHNVYLKSAWCIWLQCWKYILVNYILGKWEKSCKDIWSFAKYPREQNCHQLRWRMRNRQMRGGSGSILTVHLRFLQSASSSIW